MTERGLTTGGRRSVIVLGASNVSRGLARLVATVRARGGGPTDLVVAAGHGRAYGVNSRVWMRRLPSILNCGLWDSPAVADARAESPLALVTDVGNELLYGLGGGRARGHAAARRSRGRVVRHTPQPAWQARDGLRLWLY